MALKIVYAGSPETSLTALKILFEKQNEYNFEIAGVLSNPPSAKGRHKTLEPTPVAAFAIENNIPVFTPEHLDSAAREEVSKLNAHLLVCFAYGHIFGPKFLDLFPCGGINLHPSALPKYRGPTPVQNAILNQDDSLSITVQTLSLKMDEGDILEQKTISLNQTETAGELLDISAKEGAELICNVIKNINSKSNEAENIFEKPQGNPQSGNASYTQIIKKEDAKINWNDTAENICAKIRAYSPEPGCFTFLENSSIRILNAVVVNDLSEEFKNEPAGKILKYEKSKGLIIKTSNGYIALKRLQKQGKKEMDVKDFMNGSQDVEGKTFSDEVSSDVNSTKETVTTQPAAKTENTTANKAANIVEKLGKKAKKLQKKITRPTFQNFFENLQSSIPALIITIICALIVMAFVACAIFFATVQGPEQVLVPNVTGKPLEDALLELQVKELYPRISLRYSDTPGDEGTILSQSPSDGAIVKGYSQINLVVSRGVVTDKVDDYIGQNISDVELKLSELFAGKKQLIVLAPAEYKPDASEAGTILEQDPPAGTSISDSVTVHLIVSRGPNYENTKTPNVMNQSINDLLQTIARNKLVFDITPQYSDTADENGKVVSQQTFTTEFLPNYTRVEVVMELPKHFKDENVSGIYTVKLSEYPYPVPMKLVAYPEEGSSYTILSFSHPGGNVTIPYTVPRGTRLELSVADKIQDRQTVN